MHQTKIPHENEETTQQDTGAEPTVKREPSEENDSHSRAARARKRQSKRNSKSPAKKKSAPEEEADELVQQAQKKEMVDFLKIKYLIEFKKHPFKVGKIKN